MNALTYGGFRLDKVRIEFDPAGLARRARPDMPQGPLVFEKVLGGKALTSHTGSDGTLFFEATNASDDQVKAQIDVVKTGAGSLGRLAAWKALRARLPERATALVVVNAQEIVQMLLTIMGTVSNRPDLKPPADMPRVPALMGIVPDRLARGV